MADQNWTGMKTCTVSEAKSKLGELADAAIKGKPTVIVRGGKLVILQAYDLPDHADEFDALIKAGKDSPHRLLNSKVLDEIWKRGRALAKG
jgi:Antitoxin Phd_YefM, type II toxin-antitoxin system